MTSETLQREIGWEASGHLSDVALTAVADGEEALLDAEMRAHLDACEACVVRLGDVAVRGALVGDALSLAATPEGAEARGAAPALEVIPALATTGRGARDSKPPRRRVPWGVIAIALSLALLAVVPSLATLRADALQAWTVLLKVLPSLVRLGPQAVGRAWNGWGAPASVAIWGLALMLLAAGLVIARKGSKQLVLHGGRR